MKIRYLVLAFSLTAVAAQADNSTVDVVTDGGIGGAREQRSPQITMYKAQIITAHPSVEVTE